MKRITFTVPGTKLIYRFSHPVNIVTSQEKKNYRLSIASQLPTGFMPMHACLITNGKQTIAITGESSSGKSTLAESFRHKGFHVAANDFIVVWQERDHVFASDLNYKEENRKKKPLRIDVCILLSPYDPRDIFSYSTPDLKKYYKKTLFPLASKVAHTYTQIDLFQKLFTDHIVLGNRLSIERWEKAINRLVFSKSSFSNIGIVGVGTIGQDLANLLLTKNWVQRLHLYSKSFNKLLCVAKDFKSANASIGVYCHHNLKKVFEHSHIVVLSFNTTQESITPETKHLDERKRKMFAHAKVIWDITRVIRETNFSGHILVVTNPVDILSWCLLSFSNMDDSGITDWQGLCSSQVYGIGLGLDYERLKVISSQQMELVGEHGENIFLAKLEKGLLSAFNDDKVIKEVKQYSNKIRKFTSRTRFGPTHEILRVIEELHSPSTNVNRLSALNADGFFLGNALSFNKYRLPKKLYRFSKELTEILVNLQKKHTIHYKDIATSVKSKLTNSAQNQSL